MSNQEWEPVRYTVGDACPWCGCIVYGYHVCPGRSSFQPIPPMTTDPTPVPAPQPSLRKAASEALLAGALVLSDVMRDPAWKEQITKATEERFRKALEQLAEALA